MAKSGRKKKTARKAAPRRKARKGKTLAKAAPDAAAMPGPAAATTAEAFATGDRVRITTDALDVKAGSVGTVTRALPAGGASLVRFDGRPTEMLVPNVFLEPA
ncbi:MAG TPA: hypothetical protein VID04_06650 [Methylomirabilota bacterium]